MTRFLRRLAATLAAGMALTASASTNNGIDYSDVWLTPNESGHGVYIVQNQNTLFTTIFVYGGDTLPRWYFASGMTPVGGSTNQYSGTFYRTQGTSFASPWNPAQLFGPLQVGTMNITFSSATQGTMNYTIDGINVTQNIVRLTLASDNLSGTYFGGLIANASGCSIAVPGGYFIANRLTVDHSSAAAPRFTVDINTTGGAATCVFTGTYVQSGRMGTISNGTFSCTGAVNNAGTYAMSEIQSTRNGLSAHFTGRDQYCTTVDGYFGGMRDVL